ncbi:MAG: tellurite resistance protein TerC [Saprospiraceae bacterium]|jgi:tellurite resistance protein TerC
MIWILFIALILLLLGFDLIILHNKNQPLTNKRAAIETIFWICIALLFSLVIYWVFNTGKTENINDLSGSEAVVKYLSGYFIELSLSVDNLFVIAMIFKSYKIPVKYQHQTLFWGIIGAIVFRGLMIWLGVVLIHKISWITYIFGAFLLYTAFNMLEKEDENPSESSMSKKLSKLFKISKSLDGEKFFTIENGVKMITPLFAALIMIEFADLLFALDSIPAILAITTDSFVVFSSNMFAVLGLRAMYFFLANMLEKFRYLKYSVFSILTFVAIKLLTIHFVHFPEWFSLLYISISLALGVMVSLHKIQVDKK